MELIDQHTKHIMQGCKERARSAGLHFGDESLEYIVTNRDLLELSPKMMIPTLYDYWVHDVEVLKGRGKYELYPSNPYETVINTRPAVSFYNDNNPDWLNVMIFYHVLGHIDFFQNNLFYRHTWDYDFGGQALSDKRLIAGLRSEKGRWLDYVIEFARGIDNLVSYHHELYQHVQTPLNHFSKRVDYYFDVFLQNNRKASVSDYVKEVERYNQCLKEYGSRGEQAFFVDVNQDYPEFEALFRKSQEDKIRPDKDLLQFLMEHSPKLNRTENKWMKSVMQVVRSTSVFFQPQIRTKIMNEGWASFWHETLFLQDERIQGHEVDFARVNAGVTAMPRVGLNPYALGMRLFYAIEKMADQGRYSVEFQRLLNADQRRRYDRATGQGRKFIFAVRENLCDFLFINTFVDQDFITENDLFVAGRRLNKERMVWQYFVKSRKAQDYRQMVLDSLYHPPVIQVDGAKAKDGELYLVHRFEEKPLVQEFIANTLLGIEFLWGAPTHLETSEVVSVAAPAAQSPGGGTASTDRSETGITGVTWQRVLYTMKDRKLSKKKL